MVGDSHCNCAITKLRGSYCNSDSIVISNFQVPVKGCYSLIDIPLRNYINIKINKIYVLAQFNSLSLNHHIARTYNFGEGVRLSCGSVEVHYSYKQAQFVEYHCDGHVIMFATYLFLLIG